MILVVDADIAQSLGAILTEETGLRRRLILDVGEYLNPPGVLPVLIKSLLFASNQCRCCSQPTNKEYPCSG
jgi:ethanolamine utilization protein EutA